MAALVIFLLSFTHLLIDYSSGVSSEPIPGNEKYGTKMLYIVGISSTVKIDTVGERICTGTLVSKKHVLTALKCTKIQEDKILVANVRERINGETRLAQIQLFKTLSYREWAHNRPVVGSSTQLKRPSVICLFEDSTNLIVLILSREVEVNHPFIHKGPKYDYKVGNHYVFFGWGKNRVLSQNPLKTELVKLSNEDCKNRANAIRDRPGRFEVPKNMVCTASKPEYPGLANCDYGGPLFRWENPEYNYVVGIVTRKAAVEGYGDQEIHQDLPNLVILFDAQQREYIRQSINNSN